MRLETIVSEETTRAGGVTVACHEGHGINEAADGPFGAEILYFSTDASPLWTVPGGNRPWQHGRLLKIEHIDSACQKGVQAKPERT